MKVIDLLIKIANGEIDYTTKFDAKVNMGYCGINEYFERYPINENYLNCEIELNDEVEIIEEKKIPEKLYLSDYEDTTGKFDYDVLLTINEIIDYLKSKGE